MSRRWIAVAFVALIAVVLAALRFVDFGDDQPATALVQRGSVDVTIQTVGTLQTRDPHVIRASVSGTVSRLAVQPGDRVDAGDVVVLLDQVPFDRAIETAEHAVEAAEFRLQLSERRAATSPDDEVARLEALAASNDLDLAMRTLDDARQQRVDSVMLTSTSGVVIEVDVREGDLVGAGQHVVVVLAPDGLELVADIDELDLPNIRLGADARFRLDAYPATELNGTVESTSPQPRDAGGATIFTATIRFQAPPDMDLRPGLNADVTIVTASRDNVLLVPDAAITTVGERTFVTVVDGDNRDEREVVVGYRGGGMVEVVTGLDEGERVELRR